jgi:hypothetical protein
MARTDRDDLKSAVDYDEDAARSHGTSRSAFRTAVLFIGVAAVAIIALMILFVWLSPWS